MKNRQDLGHNLPKKSLHSRNLHQHGYDYVALVRTLPDLEHFVFRNRFDNFAIDFANPEAVLALNAALLKHHYRIDHWQLPQNALCPPIPGRADYIHYMAELLEIDLPNSTPATTQVSMLDIGTGSSGIYALLGCQLYHWTCVASDINQQSLDNISNVLKKNGQLNGAIELRHQGNKNLMFTDIVKAGEFFDLTVCNPPFHASEEDAMKANRRKLKNLNQRRTNTRKQPSAKLNFGGQSNELWCKGGEKLFLKKMIKESRDFANQIRWFSSLLSKSENLAPVKKWIRKAGAKTIREIPMTQGSKKTRIIAWTYL